MHGRVFLLLAHEHGGNSALTAAIAVGVCLVLAVVVIGVMLGVRARKRSRAAVLEPCPHCRRFVPREAQSCPECGRPRAPAPAAPR